MIEGGEDMKTIHELREESARRLAKMGDGDVAKASHILNCVYRYVHADVAQWYRDNDARRYNLKQSERAMEQLSKRYDRIQAMLRPYGVQLRSYGLYPDIEDMDRHDMCLLHYYD